jgi:hypothetical protein
MSSIPSVWAHRACVTFKELAEFKGCSIESIRKAHRLGELKAHRPGGKGDYIIFVDDAVAWLRGDGHELKSRPAPPRGRAAATA